MRLQMRRLGLFGDILASGVLSGITSLVNIASVFLMARTLDPLTFGLLSTCRRVVAFLAPLANLNGHLAISRYLGYWSSEPRQRTSVLVVGAGLLTATLPLAIGMFFLLQKLGSHVGWIGALDAQVWTGTAGLTCATGAGLVTFSILRGLGHPQAANLHQLLFSGVWLLIAFAVGGRSVPWMLAIGCTGSVAVSISHLGWVASRHRHEWQRPNRASLRSSVRETARYSLPRIADGPCQASLPLIGVLLAPGIGGLALAGYLHVGQTVVRMMEVVIVPLSVIFLPLVARQVREGKVETLRWQAQLVFDAVLLLGVYLAAQSLAWSAPLLHAAFGDKYAPATVLVLAILPAIVPYLLYAGFRSFIDGYSERPVNFLNLLVTSASILVLSVPLGHWLGGVGLALGYSLGMCVLGVATLRYVRHNLHVVCWQRHTAFTFAAGVGLGVVSWGIGRWVTAGPPLLVFAVFTLQQLVAFGAFVLLARRIGHPAITYAESRLGRLRKRDPNAALESASATPLAPRAGPVGSETEPSPEHAPEHVGGRP